MHDPPRSRGLPRLSDLAPEVAATVVRVAGDIAVVIGDDGVIRNVADGRQPLPRADHDWVGRRWADTVSQATRGRAEALLREAREHGVSRRSELNHPGAEGSEIPFSWAAVRLGDGGPLLAVGRDLRAVSAIQQRFQETQMSLEREYWQRRSSDGQHRQLFQVVHDAVLVLDADSGLVLEANAAAGALFERTGQSWAGVSPGSLVEDGQRARLDELVFNTRAYGAATELRLRTAGQGTTVDVSATLLQGGERRRLLLRARQPEPETPSILGFVNQTADAVLVADSSGGVLCANPAFLALCGVPEEVQARGRSLGALLGGDDAPWAALLARVRAEGIVEGARVPLRRPAGRAAAVSVSASSLADGDQERVGLVLRALPQEAAGPAMLQLELTGLPLQVGQATLAELLAEVARQAEAQLIRSALGLGEGDLARAAQHLGIAPEELRQRMSALALPAAGEA